MAKRGILVLVMMGLACTVALATPYPVTVDDFADLFSVNPRWPGGYTTLKVDTYVSGYPGPFPPTPAPPPSFREADWAYQDGLTGVYPNPGSRDAILTCGPGAVPGGADASSFILDSVLRYSNAQGVKSTLDLMYGNYAKGGQPLNIGADWGYDPGKVFFYFSLLASDQNGFVSMRFNTHSEGTSPDTFEALDVSMAEVAEAGPAIVQYIPLSLFKSLSTFNAPTMDDIGDIDGIAYRFYSTNTGWDMRIADLGLTIPEPATMTLLGLGVLALVRRRRKR